MITGRSAVVGVVALLVGCSEQSGLTKANLQKQIDGLTFQIEELKTQLNAQKLDRSLNELREELSKFAYLTPGADGYSLVTYDLGVLTVKIKDVQPYASGSRVTLQFGNPLSSTVTGLKLSIDWGKVSSDGVAQSQTQKTKQLTLTQELNGGAWTSIPVVLDGLPPADLGFVRVHDVEHSSVRLVGR